ncbi:putative esterase [Mycobacterium kansasii]|uniref:Putative esterase n=1 Tax=Mycobacterium kansasii TaxID=1768 RepID=A0A1V3XDV6_MYCKA|nr:putative esterase [Mycobacterium kansasii]
MVGVNNNTDFLHAIKSGMVYGTAEPLHRGRRQQLWLVVITDETDRVVARVRCGCRIWSRRQTPDPNVAAVSTG